MYIYFLVRICWNFFPSELSLPPWVTLCIKEVDNYMHLVIGHTYIPIHSKLLQTIGIGIVATYC